MFQQIENWRVIVQRKVLLVLENDLQNRSDALELLRMSLFANGWTEEGVFTCPLGKLAMKIWPVVMECLDVLIEERQRENSALGKRSASELDQSGEELTAAQRAFQDSQLEGVIKTPSVLQADGELRKAATAVLAGSAGILPAGSAASGKKPVPTWMDVDMSLLNKETETDGQLMFDQASGAIIYERTKKPTVDEWREYGLAHTLKLSGIQRTNFVELQQLYKRLIISHGFDAVYSFSLEVRKKEREFPNRAFSADLLSARFATSKWYHPCPIRHPIGPAPPRPAPPQQRVGAGVCTFFIGNGCGYSEGQCRNGSHSCSICGRKTHGASKCYDSPDSRELVAVGQAGRGRGKVEGRGRAGRPGRGRDRG
jgi:hypothetical protein